MLKYEKNESVSNIDLKIYKLSIKSELSVITIIPIVVREYLNKSC